MNETGAVCFACRTTRRDARRGSGEAAEMDFYDSLINYFLPRTSSRIRKGNFFSCVAAGWLELQRASRAPAAFQYD